MATSICLSTVTICSGLYLCIGICLVLLHEILSHFRWYKNPRPGQSEPRQDGSLEDDIVIGDYERPCDAKPGSRKLAPGIPPASLWATDPNGINQIGCVYNIQGFELDYIGVIWGKDLVYDFDRHTWVGNKKESADQVVKRSKEQFVDLVKNTYRVLLSRGMRGCYVYFMDRETERFVRSRME